MLSLIAFCAVVLTAFYTWLNIRIQKQTDEKISKLQKDLANLIVDTITIRERVCTLFEDMINIFDHLRKIVVGIDLLKLGASPSINKTIAEIMEAKKATTPREASIMLLRNLTIEYGQHIQILKQKVESAEDDEDKERLSKILEEFKNMATLLSTISDESSNEYIEQIFHEVVLGVTKIRNV